MGQWPARLRPTRPTVAPRPPSEWSAVSRARATRATGAAHASGWSLEPGAFGCQRWHSSGSRVRGRVAGHGRPWHRAPLGVFCGAAGRADCGTARRRGSERGRPRPVAPRALNKRARTHTRTRAKHNTQHTHNAHNTHKTHNTHSAHHTQHTHARNTHNTHTTRNTQQTTRNHPCCVQCLHRRLHPEAFQPSQAPPEGLQGC